LPGVVPATVDWSNSFCEGEEDAATRLGNTLARHGSFALAFFSMLVAVASPRLAAPALVGPAFLSKWEGKPLSALFEFEHQYMPAANPGSVPPDQLWAITAYVLQKNGFSPGTADLGDATAGRLVTK
jgi:hypothetical protein